MAYSTLCRRVRKREIKVSLSNKRKLDICDVCYSWDRRSKPLLKQRLEEFEARMGSIWPDYWVKWAAQASCRSSWQGCFDRLGSESYQAGLHAYVKARPALQCAALPTGVEAKDIEAEEDRFLAEWGCETGWLEQISCLNTHWKLRDRLKADIMKDQVSPKPKELYIWWDFQDQAHPHQQQIT
eukprot:6869619-Prorocentrum_lima.AAC.1